MHPILTYTFLLPPPALGLRGFQDIEPPFFESETRVRYDFDYFGVGSVEQPIDGRAAFRSFRRRRNDPAVGQDHGLAPRPPSRGVRRQKVRPRNADVSGRRSGRRLKPALASTPRNTKRGDKRAHSSNPGKAQFGPRTQFGSPISGTISGAYGDNMISLNMRTRLKIPTWCRNLRLRPPKPALEPEGDT